MKISLVVPVFNCEKYLNDCIKSVINQTADNWELILVNDGSTDKSAEICNYYSDKYPDKIFAYHKENEGQFLTRKYGIHKCSGEYIGFLDADDLLDKDYVKIILGNIEKYNCPDALCFGFCRFDEKVSKEISIADRTTYFKTPDERKQVYKMIVDGRLSGSMWSKVFKKNIVSNNIPDEEVVRSKRFAEDAYHSFEALSESEAILLIDQSLYLYRDNAAGFSQGFETKTPDYFNSQYVYSLIEKKLSRMGIENIETKNVLYNRNFNETVYFMLKYLRAAKNLKRKKEIIDFDWTEYLLDGTLRQIENNYGFKKSHLKVWKAFKNKRYVEILFREKFKKIIGW